ncbi:TolC family outer membrane protein [Candidatus Methylocalor cossyra]|uniref:Type I secretion outer membrane protein, TolC n=1 Tax=Candidatus Methylocalor cossyra TaxID=3108543 RepID=A0ABM9NHL2_9GAMM
MRAILGALVLYWMASVPSHALDLSEAYQLGLSNDPVVLQTEAKRNAAQKNKPIGIARLLPSVSFNGNLVENHLVTGKSPIFVQAYTDYVFWSGQFTLTLTQPLFHYDTWVQLWQADNQLAQAEAQLQAEYQNLAIRVARSYFQILLAEDNLEVSTAELRSLESQITQVKERLALGFSTVVDLDEVQAQHDKVVADRILYDQQLNDAKAALREIIGDRELDLVKVPDELPLLQPEPADLAAWRTTALQHNLAIIAALSGAEIAKQNIDLNFAGHLPTVDLQGIKSMADTNRPFGLQTDMENIGVYLTVPIYSGGGVNARVEQARDAYEQALHEVDRQRRAAERQVADAYRGVFSAIGRVGALKTALASAQRAVEATEMGFRVGTRTAVDVLVEQTKMFATRRDYAKARYDYLINGLLLKQAAGTLTRSDIDAVNGLLHRRRRGVEPAVTTPLRHEAAVHP